MRIIAFETSSREASVAVLDGSGDLLDVLRSSSIVGPRRTAQALHPALRDLLDDVGWLAGSVELVAVATGPGSFTGLRIGVTAAKTFAYATGAALIGVNTLAVLAEQVPQETNPLWAVMDAQRQELFAAKFCFDSDGRPQLIRNTQIISQAEWLAALRPGDWVTGPALQRLLLDLPDGVHRVDDVLWQPQATAVGRLGWREYQSGRRDDAWRLLPAYYRSSAAEEKAARRGRRDA